MRYMMFVKHAKDYGDAKAPPGLYEDMARFIEQYAKAGNFIAGAGLQPLAKGAQVRLKGGKITVVDGPFAESKEIVGGYAILDFKTRDEALDNARRFMELHLKHIPDFDGICEVRPFEEEVQP